MAGQGLQEQGRVNHVTSDRARVIHTPAEGHDAGPTHPAVRWFQTNHPTESSWHAYRTARVGADAQRHQPRGDAGCAGDDVLTTPGSGSAILIFGSRSHGPSE